MNDIYIKALEIQDEIIKTRRELHMYPEISMCEFKTAKYIRAKLTEMGIKWETDGGTGTVATLSGRTGERTLGLRGDIDALSVMEINECEYKSKNPGVMHACGHDAHAAALLAAAKILKSRINSINGTIKLIFQAGEENGEGAAAMVQSGKVDDVDAFFALHVASHLKTGAATIRSGVMSSANDQFKIRIKGKGCHGSTPQFGADALLAGASLVQTMQAVITHENDPRKPSVLNVGVFNSGTAFNVLSGNAYIEGSIRVMEEEQRDVNRKTIARMAESIASAYKCTAKCEFIPTAYIVTNDEKLTEIAKVVGQDILGKGNVTEQPVNLGAEDFAAFCNVAPVTYMNIGSGNENKGTTAPHHHGNFEIDEDCLAISAAIYALFAQRYFQSI